MGFVPLKGVLMASRLDYLTLYAAVVPLRTPQSGENRGCFQVGVIVRVGDHMWVICSWVHPVGHETSGILEWMRLKTSLNHSLNFMSFQMTCIAHTTQKLTTL